MTPRIPENVSTWLDLITIMDMPPRDPNDDDDDDDDDDAKDEEDEDRDPAVIREPEPDE
jgi:hypothetical protein